MGGRGTARDAAFVQQGYLHQYGRLLVRELGRRVRVEEHVVARDAESGGQAGGDDVDVDVDVRVLVRISEDLESGVRQAFRHRRFERALAQAAGGRLRAQTLHDEAKLRQALELRVGLLVERLSRKAISGRGHGPLPESGARTVGNPAPGFVVAGEGAAVAAASVSVALAGS